MGGGAEKDTSSTESDESPSETNSESSLPSLLLSASTGGALRRCALRRASFSSSLSEASEGQSTGVSTRRRGPGGAGIAQASLRRAAEAAGTRRPRRGAL